MSIFCIGQMGWDKTTIGKNHKISYGGSVLHFSLAALIMGVKSDLLCYVNKSEWKNILNDISDLGIGIENVLDYKNTISFNMFYDDEMQFIEEKFSMDISKDEPLIYDRIEKCSNYEIYNVCETTPEQDLATINKIKEFKPSGKVSIQLHIDNLLRSLETYKMILSVADYIFMNIEESLLLTDSSDITSSLKLLSQYKETVFFVTSHTKNYVLYNGEIKYDTPIFIDCVVDPTGAGDCFAGGAMAAIYLFGDLDIALKYGAICSYLKLKGYSSDFLLDTLKKKKRG